MRFQRLRFVSLLAVPLLIGGTALAGCSSDGGGGGVKKGAQVALEPAGVVAAAPFVKAPQTDVRGIASSPGGAQTSGDARGAFGGTRQASQCDKAQLVKELTGDPVKARAWAQARGIDPDKIGTHIESLTSVILLHDTLVENHNYQGDGKTTAYPSVLQTGIAVLVDVYGQPAVKCNCGNPLGKPDDVDREASTYTGSRWSGFASTDVTVIVPRPPEKGPMTSIPLVDPYQRDKGFDRTVGSNGNSDTKPFPVPTPTAAKTPPAASDGSSSGAPSDAPSSPASTPPGSTLPGSDTPGSTPGRTPGTAPGTTPGTGGTPGKHTPGVTTPGTAGTPGKHTSEPTPGKHTAEPEVTPRHTMAEETPGKHTPEVKPVEPSSGTVPTAGHKPVSEPAPEPTAKPVRSAGGADGGPARSAVP